ncbi:unannotated protein [freshwater metagenome]|uniref:Unannotated protein n=1 Tax=freshwater metagenome TaxID=449393 RepID=A0A6J7HR85_9ZZZZ
MARRTRGSLDAERVVEAAFALARETGLAELTMTEVAARLGVGLTSVYWHVRTRDELLARMAEQAVVRLRDELPELSELPPSGWRGQLREYFVRQRQAFTDDELLADLTVMRNAPAGPDGVTVGFGGVESVLRHLAAAGFLPADAWYLYAALSLYTQGFVVAERRRRSATYPPTGAEQVRLLDPTATPLLAGLVAEHDVVLDHTGDTAFTAGLDLLLDGAGTRLAGARTA